jgi:malonate-semialdehyde dehydrogenase (acetylating) / methylmalonate-semialdehyde dehydrogenase
MSAAIIDDAPEGHQVLTVELFGPVLTLVRAADLDEAIAKVSWAA